MSRNIYLDYNASTPLDERVLDAMMPYLKHHYANPSSIHFPGQHSKKVVEKSRSQIANLLDCSDEEIIFTSGSTESLNLALKGIALHPLNNKKHIITVTTEHKAVLETCHYLESIGFEVEYLPVKANGIIDLNLLKKVLRKDTLLACIMWVNNETGVIQPIEEIGKLLSENGVLFVCDATQAVGKINVLPKNVGISLMSFSGHKMYGPKGIGGLFINNEKISRRNFTSIQHGGGQEKGFRSGTYNTPAIAGLGVAAFVAKNQIYELELRIRKMRDKVEESLLKIPGVFINGDKNHRIYNTTNICIPNFDITLFIEKHKNIAVSNGSACTSAVLEPSYVLKEMGLSDDDAFSSLRISLGIYTTIEDIDTFNNIILQEVKELKVC